MSELIGKKIKDVRNMTEQELNAEGWDTKSHVICLVFEDGTKVYPSADDEGNYGGLLFGITTKGKQVCHYVTEK